MVVISAASEGRLSTQLDVLLQGRNTTWYKGRLGRLNLIVVSTQVQLAKTSTVKGVRLIEQAFLVITQANNGFDGSMMNALQTIAPWRDYFHNPQGSTLALFNAIQTIGGIPGLLISPYVADKIGRRRCLFVGLCFMMLGTILQTATVTVGMFIAARGIIGFGLSFAGLAAPLLIGELAFPSHRGTATSFFGVSYSLGSIIAAWTTFGTFRIASTWSWRIPSLLQGLPTLIQILGIFFIPESPRWLVNRGRDEEAIQILTKWHCDGDADDPLVAYEYQEIREAINMEKEAKDSTSYKSLVSTPGNRKRLLVVVLVAFFSQWSGNGLVSYYLNLVLNGVGITSTGSQTLFNGILAVFSYATAILGALVVEKAGRRTLFLVSTGGMCGAYCIWTACSAVYAKSATNLDSNGVAIGANVAAGRVVLAMIFVYYGFYNIAFSPLLSLYTIEITPFRTRAKFLTIGSLCINCALVFNQYANPIALKALAWKYYIVYCCVLAAEFVICYFLIVETVGKNGPLPLEITNFLFDGEEATQRVEAHGADAIGHGPKVQGDLTHNLEGDEKMGEARVEDVKRVV